MQEDLEALQELQGLVLLIRQLVAQEDLEVLLVSEASLQVLAHLEDLAEVLE